MKPVMFCRNSRGMARLLHSWIKWAPFWALSLWSTPLLARIPTGMPWMRANPVTSVVPNSALNSSNTDPSTRRAMSSRAS
ncbi:hypothetical protein D3C78_1201700 [compost metagenome]